MVDIVIFLVKFSFYCQINFVHLFKIFPQGEIFSSDVYHKEEFTSAGLVIPFVIGSYHEMFTWLANNYEKSLKICILNMAIETIFSFTLSDWFNK